MRHQLTPASEVLSLSTGSRRDSGTHLATSHKTIQWKSTLSSTGAKGRASPRGKGKENHLDTGNGWGKQPKGRTKGKITCWNCCIAGHREAGGFSAPMTKTPAVHETDVSTSNVQPDGAHSFAEKTKTLPSTIAVHGIAYQKPTSTIPSQLPCDTDENLLSSQPDHRSQ